MSSEEKAEANQQRLDARRKQLRKCAEALLTETDIDEDRESEILAQLVDAALEAYMRISNRDRPETEHWMMSGLAFKQIRIRREIREEMKAA